MINQIKLFLIGLILIIILDAIWLKLVMGNIFTKEIGNISKPLNIYVALLVWSVMVIGILIFVLPQSNPLIYGALFGFILYAVYDLTNFATLQAWTIKFLIIDIVWGTFLCGVTSYLLSLASKFI
jgi:uncharacterized membrane protein